ncbi:unnamed protein product, partial [Mesorhabditis belari]|uniref:CCDC22 N-terminal domain-containing protein n=1 Tax=Mesorhabditis belari TaxID=2138241 RepID=A0AAF3FIJ5_9BILA
MKEFEKHIVDFSKQLGCSFTDEDAPLQQWSTENCFEFLTRCLWKIDPETQYESVKEQLLAQACSTIQPGWVPEFCRRLMMRYDGRFWCPSEDFPEYVSPFQDVDHRKALQAGSDSRKWIAALLRIGGLKAGSLGKMDAMIVGKPRPAPKPRQYTI